MTPDRLSDPDVIEWLLSDDDSPTVRLLTMRDLLDLPPADPAIVAARRLIMQRGPVPALLVGQDPAGHWGDPERMYTDKYHGTLWRVLMLAELAADPASAAVRAACEFVLSSSQEAVDGGFAMHGSANSGGGRQSEVIPCLTGNMVFSLSQLGYLSDPRVLRAIDWITRYQRFDDGVAEGPTGSPYYRHEICFGTHSCHMGVAKALKALAAIPAADRSTAVRSAIDQGVEYLLKHHIHKRSHNLTAVSKPGWLRFGFPLMHQTDVLELLLILTSLGCRDPRMDEAIEVLRERRRTDGRWASVSVVDSERLPVEFEARGQPSRWITLRALTVLRRLEQATAAPD